MECSGFGVAAFAVVSLVANFLFFFSCVSPAVKDLALYQVNVALLAEELHSQAFNETGSAAADLLHPNLPSYWYGGISGICDIYSEERHKTHCRRAFLPTQNILTIVEDSLRSFVDDNAQERSINKVLVSWNSTLTRLDSSVLRDKEAKSVALIKASAALIIVAIVLDIVFLFWSLFDTATRSVYFLSAMSGLIAITAGTLATLSVHYGMHAAVNKRGYVAPVTIVVFVAAALQVLTSLVGCCFAREEEYRYRDTWNPEPSRYGYNTHWSSRPEPPSGPPWTQESWRQRQRPELWPPMETQRDDSPPVRAALAGSNTRESTWNSEQGRYQPAAPHADSLSTYIPVIQPTPSPSYYPSSLHPPPVQPPPVQPPPVQPPPVQPPPVHPPSVHPTSIHPPSDNAPSRQYAVTRREPAIAEWVSDTGPSTIIELDQLAAQEPQADIQVPRNRGTRNEEVGYRGEEYIFDLLTQHNLPNFSGESNWTSGLRNLRDRYPPFPIYKEKYYADFTYRDTTGAMHEVLRQQGVRMLPGWSKKTRYHLEVKSTPGRCETTLSVSVNQRELMKRYHGDPNNAYILVRVFNVESSNVGVRWFPEPLDDDDLEWEGPDETNYYAVRTRARSRL
ncbi:hypothetical protein B0T21DRAFT_353802 [Apiosordaria backusii]|uniref:Uncharacterized protein n=1 Tax=Apiosordaria backusii TaxID=314023 RepID=A0AA39ZPF4_9PEZI|nr:hypothetical protein B0T21DRAFT_353802 [Apiosordaria backusii]